MTVSHCPSTLASGFDAYSPLALRRLFAGKRISPLLLYAFQDKEDKEEKVFSENLKRVSISGVQDKWVCVTEKGKIRLSQKGEQSTHILKPIPFSRLKRVNEIPANEHLTMQIASQVFHIETAENGLCFFKEWEAAYLTKRFDVALDGSKLRVEDFASLAGLSSVTGGSNFKYAYSYEGIVNLIKRYVPAWPIELEKFFKLVLFIFQWRCPFEKFFPR